MIDHEPCISHIFQYCTTESLVRPRHATIVSSCVFKVYIDDDVHPESPCRGSELWGNVKNKSANVPIITIANAESCTFLI